MNLILYSYFLYGLLETIGSFLNYFQYMVQTRGYAVSDLFFAWDWSTGSAEEVDYNLLSAASGSSVFFTTLICCQIGHMMSIRWVGEERLHSLRSLQLLSLLLLSLQLFLSLLS